MIHLDPPSPQIITTPYFGLRGWIDTATSHIFELRILEKSVEWSQEQRPDLPDFFGFNVYADLATLIRDVKMPEELWLEIYDSCCNRSELSQTITIEPSAILACKRELEGRNLRRQFIYENVTNKLEVSQDEFDNRVFNPDSIQVHDKIDPISANSYGPKIWEFLSKFDKDSKILEAGAGYRYSPVLEPLVINQELFKYPSTDLACDLHQIPIRDNTFDGAIIAAVFEHVQNPFKVALELSRVVKPGGLIYVDVPFLQAEHGYPYHFFNMTRMGVRQIFSGVGEVLEHSLTESNHTKHAVSQILNLYIDAVSRNNAITREKIHKMTIGHFLEFIQGVSLLPEDDFKTAWGTTSIIRIL